MSTRERWTVYPLLFLTLGIALKDKLTREVSGERVVAGTVVCKALVVVDEAGNSRVIIDSNAGGGLVKVIGVEPPHVSLGHHDRVTGLEFHDGRGNIHFPGSILMQRSAPSEAPKTDTEAPTEPPAETPADATPAAPAEQSP